MRFLSILGLVAVQAVTLSAQVLNDFSAFNNPLTTYFNGNWSTAGNLPLASFNQGSGVYNITGGTNDSSAGVDYYFSDAGGGSVPVSIGANRYLSLTASLLPLNTATSITITLFDSAGSTHFATTVFDLSSFSTGSYSTSVSALSADAGFNWTSIQGFTMTGAVTAGALPLNISFDSLSAVSAVPEPATYAAILGLVTLGLVGYRRFRRS